MGGGRKQNEKNQELGHGKGISCHFFYWNIVALQGCIIFCHTGKGISHRYTYIPLFWISFSFRSPSSIKQSSLCYTVGSHQLSILYIVSTVYVCQSQSLNSSHHHPFPIYHMFDIYVCVSITALQIRSSVPFFQIPYTYTCVNIQ